MVGAAGARCNWENYSHRWRNVCGSRKFVHVVGVALTGIADIVILHGFLGEIDSEGGVKMRAVNLRDPHYRKAV